MDVEKMTYTVKELAALMNIGKNAAYDLVHQENFPKILIGKSIRIPCEAFHTWLNSQR